MKTRVTPFPLIFILNVVSATTGRADAVEAAKLQQLPAGRSVLVGEDLNALALVGGTSKDRELRVVSVNGLPFAEAFRVRTIVRPNALPELPSASGAGVTGVGNKPAGGRHR